MNLCHKQIKAVLKAKQGPNWVLAKAFLIKSLLNVCEHKEMVEWKSMTYCKCLPCQHPRLAQICSFLRGAFCLDWLSWLIYQCHKWARIGPLSLLYAWSTALPVVLLWISLEKAKSDLNLNSSQVLFNVPPVNGNASKATRTTEGKIPCRGRSCRE